MLVGGAIIGRISGSPVVVEDGLCGRYGRHAEHRGNRDARLRGRLLNEGAIVRSEAGLNRLGRSVSALVRWTQECLHVSDTRGVLHTKTEALLPKSPALLLGRATWCAPS